MATLAEIKKSNEVRKALWLIHQADVVSFVLDGLGGITVVLRSEKPVGDMPASIDGVPLEWITEAEMSKRHYPQI